MLVVHCGSTPDERRSAIYEMKAQPTEEHVARIRGLLDDPDRDVRATALNAMAQLDVPDMAALLRHGIEDEDGFVRATAAKLLGDLGDPAQADVLADHLLGDPDPIARQRAAEALAEVGGERAIVALVRALSDPMERVRLVAVDGVRKLDPGRATEQLAELLSGDDTWEIRVRAARALGASGDPAAVPALKAALDDQNEFVRSAATHALQVHEMVRGRGEGPAQPVPVASDASPQG